MDRIRVTFVYAFVYVHLRVLYLWVCSCCCGKLVGAPWVVQYSNTRRHYTILSLVCDQFWLLVIPLSYRIFQLSYILIYLDIYHNGFLDL